MLSQQRGELSNSNNALCSSDSKNVIVKKN